MIKLYPIFAFGVFLRRGRRRAVEAALAVLVPFTAYVFLTLDDLELIREKMTRSVFLSWGASVLPMELGISGGAETLFVVTGLVICLAASVGLAVLWRKRPSEAPHDGGRRLDAFWIGAGVYLGTFAVGSNFNYKLICLIFIVPQLLA